MDGKIRMQLTDTNISAVPCNKGFQSENSGNKDNSKALWRTKGKHKNRRMSQWILSWKTGCKGFSWIWHFFPKCNSLSSPIEMPDWRAGWCQYL